MSRMGYCGVCKQEKHVSLGGEELGSYLGYGLVVDVDQVARRGVDLEGLVEGESGFK